MKKIRTLAMYLPQFHRIPENDKWWGEGFTEWETVKAALPLYEGHCQPRVPLDHNYYNLLEEKTLIWQTDLMHRYGIDGLCFYHYYFKNGKKVLEKPAENLLKWDHIDMPFCFCWDSASWARTWSNIKGNSWADTFEKRTEQEEGILLEQRYGRKEDWLNHFEYLLPFFKDERYIKVREAPVFIIYSPGSIYCINEMMAYWRRLAKQNGFPDLYIIGANMTHNHPALDAVLLHAPHMFWRLYRDRTKQNVLVFDFDEVWENIIKTPPVEGIKTYYESPVRCDDTPRKGKKNGIVMQGFHIDKFYGNLKRLYKKSISLENEFIFINAWNEWGEGMYLEPDEENGYQYLETVKKAKEDALKAEDDLDIKYNDVSDGREDSILYDRYEKNRRICHCLDRWMILKESKKNLSEYLCMLGINKVAIYGMGILGNHLLTELKDGPVKVDYLIDKNTRIQFGDYRLLDPDDKLEDTDAIIITVTGEFDAICSKLCKKTNAVFINIEEIIYES